jgi:hypothetical protein
MMFWQQLATQLRAAIDGNKLKEATAILQDLKVCDYKKRAQGMCVSLSLLKNVSSLSW